MNIIVTNQKSYVLANKIFNNKIKVLKYKGDHKEVRQKSILCKWKYFILQNAK